MNLVIKAFYRIKKLPAGLILIHKFTLFFLLITTLPAVAQKDIELKSPDGNIIFSFQLTREAPVYSMTYKGEPGFKFLKELPTTWDETIVPDAEVDKYVTVVRRKGDNWYVGSINNSKSRTIKVPLNFLPEGEFTAEIYRDAPDAAQNPNHLIKDTEIVSKSDVLAIDLASGGGQVMRLVKM